MFLFNICRVLMPKKKLLIAIGVAAAFVVGTAFTVSHLLISQVEVKSLAKAPLPQVTLPADQSKAGDGDKKQPRGVAMVVAASAKITDEDGTEVSLEVTPSPTPCEETRLLTSRNVDTTGFVSNVSLNNTASWCVYLAEGVVPPKASELPGSWKTVDGRDMSLDSSNAYVSLKHVSGKKLGARAVAAALCDGETGKCAATTLLELSVDDESLMLPIVKSKSSTVLVRLSND